MKPCKRGLHSFEGKQCLECQRESSRRWKSANKGPTADYAKDYRAKKGETVRQKARARVRAWVAANRERRLAYSRRHYAENAADYSLKGKAARSIDGERIRAARRASRKANPGKFAEWDEAKRLRNPEKWRERQAEIQRRRRGRLRGVTVERVTRQQLHDLYERQGGKCRYCHADIAAKKHLDHIVALANGGAHQIENLCFACPWCNQRKGAKSVEDFIREYGLTA